MASKYYKLKDHVDHLNSMFNEILSSEHFAKINYKEYKPYYPSYFLYAFFLFNSIYNIDWEKTFAKNDGYLYEPKDSERNKIRHLINFCLSDIEFVESKNYREVFLGKLKHYAYDELLNGIREDMKPNGNFYSKKEKKSINKFKANIRKLITDQEFEEKLLFKIVEFVYLVRCNIVHGIKSIQELNSDDQRNRLFFYKDILMAVNKMVLDKADYLLNQPYEEEEELEEEDQ